MIHRLVSSIDFNHHVSNIRWTDNSWFKPVSHVLVPAVYYFWRRKRSQIVTQWTLIFYSYLTTLYYRYYLLYDYCLCVTNQSFPVVVQVVNRFCKRVGFANITNCRVQFQFETDETHTYSIWPAWLITQRLKSSNGWHNCDDSSIWNSTLLLRSYQSM